MKKRWWIALGAAAATGITVSRALSHAASERVRVDRLQELDAPHGKSILILGAGFGGVNTCSGLLDRLPPESGWQVTTVDRHNYHLFTPLLYHAATGLVEPATITFPVRNLTRASNFTFRQAVVQGIDLANQVVHLDNGSLPYDYLVISLGSVTNFFGKEADLAPVLTLKTVADSIEIRNRIIDAFEQADATTDPEERRRLLTFVVVGGGATGVELAGAIRGFVRDNLAPHYPRIGRDEPGVVMFEAEAEILPGLPRDLAGLAVRRLGEIGVQVRLRTRVERVTEEGLLASGGELLPTATVIWTAGIRPAPVLDATDLPRLKNGRLEVDSYLQVTGWPNVYAIGDAAGSLDPATGKPLPGTAAVAVRQADALARILPDRLEGRESAPFRYVSMGELVSLGRHDAVAEIQGHRFTGFIAWLLWRAFYLSRLMGFKNRVQVALDWTFAYAYQRNTARLDTPGDSGERGTTPA